MRYAALLILLFMVMVKPALSQDQEIIKHEVSIGYGFGSTSEVLDVFSDILATGLTGGYYSSDNMRYTGALHVAYKHFINEKWTLGGTFVYEGGKGDVWYNSAKSGTVQKNYYTIAVEGDYRYVRKKNFSLYAGLGLGYTLNYEVYQPMSGAETDSNTGNFNFQLIGIGARFGSGLGGFVEAGFGYKGIICAGFFLRR